MAKPKLGRPRLSRYPYCVLAVNLRTDLRKAIKKQAKCNGLATSAWVRYVLEIAVDERWHFDIAYDPPSGRSLAVKRRNRG
jgi:hypothetical protein